MTPSKTPRNSPSHKKIKKEKKSKKHKTLEWDIKENSE